MAVEQMQSYKGSAKYRSGVVEVSEKVSLGGVFRRDGFLRYS